MTPYIDMKPSEVRQLIREGVIDFPTAGMCRGYAQANLIILPPEYAADFEKFAELNPFPCPILEIIKGEQPLTHAMGEGGNICSDIPRYRIYRDGVWDGETLTDVTEYWKQGYVGFLIGCSFSFEEALMKEGIEVRHIAQGRNVPMYKVGIQTVKAGPFEGPMVCSMRPMTPENAQKAYDITVKMPNVHGAPVHMGPAEGVGVADVMVESVGTLATFTPLANFEAMPYLFNSYDHFMEVWYGDLGEEIKTAVGEAAGFKLMGASYRGPRIVTATKEMKEIEDFKGFKLRAPNLEMYIKTWEWFNAAPTPMAMNEVYTALQQKTVEGQENPMVDSMKYGFAEVCDYWIKTNHVYGCNVVIMDKAYFEGLPADIQDAVIEAANYAGEEISKAQAEKDAAAEEELKAMGKTVIEVDNLAFAEYFSEFATENYPDFADWYARAAELDPGK